MAARIRRMTDPEPETVFTYGAPTLKFGDGASDEIGYDLAQLGARRALVITDPGVAATGLPDRIAAQMAQFGVQARVFDGVHIEPTDASMQARNRLGPRERSMGCVRRGRRGVEHRHREGGRPAAHQPRRTHRLRQRAGRRRARRPASRCSRWSPSRRPPAPAPRAPRSAFSTSWRNGSRAASVTRGCGRRSPSSTPPDHAPSPRA